MALVFVALTLVVQCLAVFQPPESANAASSNDLVYGGLGLGANRSINNFLAPYDANTNNLKDITTHIGITRAEIVASQYSSFLTASNKYSWGHHAKYSVAQGERAVDVTNAAGAKVTTVYARPMTLANGTGERIYSWIGYSAKVGWFAIMQACGNIVTETIPTPKPPVTNILQSKSAINVSQGSVNATTVTAREGDQISYTISIENKGTATNTVKFEEQLEDVLEYAKLSDSGGGTFNQTAKTLTWPDVILTPGQKQSRTFTVRVLDVIPATAQGASEPTSYNCQMTNVFGNSVAINVNCSPPKIIENVVTQLPKTGPTENMIFAGIILAIVTYFYARTRQVNKEVRLIRRDLNAGTI
jgi:uncharacterized repeat protein (TIGR01451 family)